MISESRSLEIWERLSRGRSLADLALGSKDGRVDLRGLMLTDPSILRQYQTTIAAITEVETRKVSAVKWHNLDFTGSKLSTLRFVDCEVINCVFDECELRDLRVWSTTFTDCSFKAANLRGAMLAGVKDHRRTVYVGIDFSKADLRQTVYKAGSFERCLFHDAKLAKIDFQSSTFVDCVFEGELRDVLFYERGFKGDEFPPNKMINVDFSRAVLHAVAFRGLNLDRVKLPEDSSHIVIRRDVPATLDWLSTTLQQQSDATASKLNTFLNIDREWIPPQSASTRNQR